MKKCLILLCAVFISLSAAAQLNITFRSSLTYNGEALSNIGGYVDSSGNEYALVGYEQGLSIVDVTNPTAPVVAFDVPGTTSIWREVKTWQNYAYVTTEGCCNGLQIINLGYLPDSIQVKYWTGDGAIAGQLETIHALHVDEGHVYLYGSNLFNGSALVVDLADPWNPVYKSHTPGTYVHDGYVRNDTLWSGHIYDGYFSVFDVTNKSNPVLLATQLTPTQFTHNTWLNDAGTVLFTTDENSGSYLGAYDITDLSNIRELDRLQLTPGSGSVIHNTHTLNDYEVISWYKDGVAIVDVSRPDNMIVTGFYDTYPQGSGNGFNGAWGVYPFLPSGNLVVSDIDNGLIVLTPTYVRGCYLEGLVTDSVTGLPINNAIVTILGPSITKNTKLNGEYKTGLAAAGVYDIQFSKAGYITKTINGVSLQNGVLASLNVQLVSSVTQITLAGQVIENGTGTAIPNATIQFNGSLGDFNITSDANGQFNIPGFFTGNYNLTAGKWGYQTSCSNNQNITGTSNPLTITLNKGYYDDFALDFGWTVSGPSGNQWERAVPIGTTLQGSFANPNVDVSGDCSNLAMVTDNGGGGPWDNDVDQGSTILTSPVFDLTGYANPQILYSRWFFNGGITNGAPDDSMKIFLSNGNTTVLIEALGPNNSSSSWVPTIIPVSSFITPSANMQLIVNVGDPGPVFNIVEGGFDLFSVEDFVSVSEVSAANNPSLLALQNPFLHETTIRLLKPITKGSLLTIHTPDGKIIEQITLTESQTQVNLGQNYPAGLYLVHLNGSAGAPVRIIKL